MIKAVVITMMVLVAGAIFIPLSLLHEIETEKLDEKGVAVSNALGRLSGYIDREIADDRDWAAGHVEDSISMYMAEYDKEPMTAASAYKRTGAEWVGLSERTPTFDVALEPFDYENFVVDVERAYESGTDSGKVKILFEPKGEEPREVYLIYRVIPKHGDIPDFLLVVGISKYTVETETASLVYVEILVYMCIAFIACFFVVMVIVKYFTDINGRAIKSAEKRSKIWIRK